LVYTAGLNGQGLYVLLNDQHGGFTEALVPHYSANSVTLADLNADGNLDAVVQSAGEWVRAFLGNGKGAFEIVQDRIPYTFLYYAAPQIGDVNGDGIPDLLMPMGSSIGIALGTGKGTF